ncbi:DUF1902 domain-containing protein [Hydromonas duriensis]|uniref:Putative RNase H-like HicB family nuclease n=1 Tax=Hydromonas duriensis TaxID=1527608 RepID=A0A4R6Y6S2_9BURK|nr:DUF1902 domain-containing protein [Hydromonas duriensis]TDR27783.1 putative RNase H-like HicB family nuclease [Hydromonas duriensis]
MKYRIGFMGWKFAALLGVPLKLVVQVIHDDEAGVFVARCPDVKGLIAEAATLDELADEVSSSLMDLLEHQHQTPVPPSTEYRLINQHVFA